MPNRHIANPPRFEFRIWSSDPVYDAALSGPSWQLVESGARADIYVLRAGTTKAPASSVKLRDGRQLDIKVRLWAGADLEKWTVDCKCDFPLSRDAFDRAAAWLEVDAVPCEQARCTPAHFIAAIQSVGTSLYAALVLKTRQAFERGDVSAELCKITVGNTHLKTIAVEGEDAEAVRDTVADLGLSAHANQSFEAKLSELLDAAREVQV